MTVRATSSDGSFNTQVMTISVNAVQEQELFYFTVQSNFSPAQGVSFADEDIIVYDGTDFSSYFDGSVFGLAGYTINAFAIHQGGVYMSFYTPGSVQGIAFDDSDVLRFIPTLPGDNTTGTWELYFDGSDVGLSSGGEDIDAISFDPDGKLLVSTLDRFRVPGVSGNDEDLILFDDTSLGLNTSGTWTMYFDGSDVGLGNQSSEDVDAVSVASDGTIYLSTIGNFSVSGISGKNEDVFVFHPNQLGNNTSGSYDSQLYFNGIVEGGLGSNNIGAIFIPSSNNSGAGGLSTTSVDSAATSPVANVIDAVDYPATVATNLPRLANVVPVIISSPVDSGLKSDKVDRGPQGVSQSGSNLVSPTVSVAAERLTISGNGSDATAAHGRSQRIGGQEIDQLLEEYLQGSLDFKDLATVLGSLL